VEWKGSWTYELAAGLLAIGAALLLHFRQHNTLEEWYLLLLLAGATIISFTVGFVLGYLTERGLEPGDGLEGLSGAAEGKVGKGEAG